MRKAQHPRPTPSLLAAFFASAGFWLVWLATFVERVGAIRGSRRLRACVNALERWAERVLLIAASARLAPRPLRTFHRSTPPGFRRVRRSWRLFFKGAHIRVRGTLAQRLAAIAAALENPDRFITHFLKRLRRGLSGTRLVIAAPRADEVVTRALPAHACDSS